MNYAEVLENAKKTIGTTCKVCPVCNGVACKNTMPGPGSKAPGLGANDNYKAWRAIKLNMDTIMESGDVDTSTHFLGRNFAMPLMTAPIGSIKLQYNPESDVADFNEECMAACEKFGIMHAFGNGLEQRVWDCAVASCKAHGTGIPVFNPNTDEHIRELMDLFDGVDLAAMGIVVDSAGLPMLRALAGRGAGTKSVQQLAALKEYSKRPLIIKGIMTAKGAVKAVEAGADAIIVSNHGGRVLTDTPSTAEVLPEIVEAVDGHCKIMVDGGIRSGVDMFKALALGADMVLICRPVLISYYGGGEEGMRLYFEKIRAELSDTMYLCGARSIAEITRDMVRL